MQPSPFRSVSTFLLASSALVGLSACEVQVPGVRTEPARVEATADAAAGEVPFRLVGPNESALVVDVHINGEGPFPFVLDTGATLTCLDDALAARLGVEEAHGITAGGATVSGSGEVRMVRIDSLQVGGTTVHDLLGCTIDLQHLKLIPDLEVDGLLGLNVIKSFRMTLDFEREVMTLEPI